MSRLWIDGRLIDKAEAHVSPFDHGFLYGDGVWEHFRIFAGALFRPDSGVKRLFAAAGDLGIDIALSPAELLAAIDTTVKANDRAAGYVRTIVSRGAGTLGPDPRKIVSQTLIVAEEYQPFPQELYGHGLHVVAAPQPVQPSPYRTLGQPHLVQAKRHALRSGCLDALLVTASGTISGTTEGCVFAVHRGEISMHSDGPRDTAAEAACEFLESDRRSVRIAPLPLNELRTVDEAFLVGTTCGVIGLIRLDGHDLGPSEGPITRSLRDSFRKIAHASG